MIGLPGPGGATILNLGINVPRRCKLLWFSTAQRHMTLFNTLCQFCPLMLRPCPRVLTQKLGFGSRSELFPSCHRVPRALFLNEPNSTEHKASHEMWNALAQSSSVLRELPSVIKEQVLDL